MNGTVEAIFICLKAGEPMQKVEEIRALLGEGLQGDRYATGEGSFNKGDQGKRQVTLINDLFFEGSGFELAESRRNIVTRGIELMSLIGRDFQIGKASFHGVKYCNPCTRPNTLSGNKRSFREAFFDRGGLIARVIEGGLIRTGDQIVPPPRGY